MYTSRLFNLLLDYFILLDKDFYKIEELFNVKKNTDFTEINFLFNK